MQQIVKIIGRHANSERENGKEESARGRRGTPANCTVMFTVLIAVITIHYHFAGSAQ